MARNMDTGRITLVRTSAGWFARYRGQVAEDVRMAFRTDTIPTPFTRDAHADDVQRDIAARYPCCIVEVQ